MAKKEESYPSYSQLEDGSLVALVSPTEMYLLRECGSNKNLGFVLDYFITRKQVLKYLSRGEPISRSEFRSQWSIIVNRFFDKI